MAKRAKIRHLAELVEASQDRQPRGQKRALEGTDAGISHDLSQLPARAPGAQLANNGESLP